MTNYAKKHPYILTANILAIGVIIMFLLGFRLQPDLRVSKNGNLEVTFPLASTTLFIDNEKVTTTNRESETVTKSLSVKIHSVIVARAGYFPWAKDVAITPGETTIIEPIFVTQMTTGQIITKNDQDYISIRNQVRNTALPTEINPNIKNGVIVWVANNTIYSKENDVVKKIITPTDPIRSLDFYKDRTDVVVFASDSGVYALEALEDAVGNKANFFPLFKGTQPNFLKTDNSFLYVLDGETLSMVVI